MKIYWTPEAERDRQTIWDYIVEVNPLAAITIDELFSNAVERLADFPFLGHRGRIPNTYELKLRLR